MVMLETKKREWKKNKRKKKQQLFCHPPFFPM
jgi:hypothetical protein